MPLQIERDPKHSLRFYLTLPESDVPPVVIRQVDLRIQTADQLLAAVKKKMGESAGQHIVQTIERSKQKGMLPSGTIGATEAHVMKRPKVGATPAHYRVGLRVTFNDPAHAVAFATAFGVK